MALDQFLKIGDIEGESRDSMHSGEIEVLSWLWGVTQSGTMHKGSGGGSGKVSVKDITLTKVVDKSTPVLIQSCCNGTQFPEAKLVVRKAGGTDSLEYLTITMSKVIITEVETGGDQRHEQISEKVVLNFGEVSIDYQEQAADGSPAGGTIRSGWNIAGNRPL